MCELFGMSCAAPDRATQSLPVFSNRYSSSNPDGWGLAYYQGGRAIVEKNPTMAKGDPSFREAVARARSEVIVAHLRHGNVGGVCRENCHPFLLNSRGADMVFAHNGTVRGIARSPDRTDSESVFHELITEAVNYAGGGRIHGDYPGIVRGIKTIFNRYGRAIHLNFLLSDGAMLYTFSHYPGKPMFLLRREKDYGDAILVATQKLSSENWLEIPADRLLVLNRGRVFVLSDSVMTGQ